jgi:hypothetical protein
VNDVRTATAEQNITDLVWDSKDISCLGTRRPLTEVLTEIKEWMMLSENRQEIVMIYYDTKHALLPWQITKTNDLMRDLFGSMLYKASELGNPLLQFSPNDLLTMGKRILFENMNDCWTKSTDSETIVFTPPLWMAHQFKKDEMTEFPDCSVQGDKEWYGKTQ